MHHCVQGSEHKCTGASLTQCSCLDATVACLLMYHNIHNLAGSQSASAMYASVAGCSRRTNTSVEHSHYLLSTDDTPVQATACLQAIAFHHLAMSHVLGLLASNTWRERTAMSNDVHIARLVSS